MKSLTDFIKESKAENVNEGFLAGAALTLLGSIVVFGLMALGESVIKDPGIISGHEDDLTLKEQIKFYGIVIGTIRWLYFKLDNRFGPMIKLLQTGKYQKDWEKTRDELLSDPTVKEFIRQPKRFKKIKDIKSIIKSHNISKYVSVIEEWSHVIMNITPEMLNEFEDAQNDIQ